MLPKTGQQPGRVVTLFERTIMLHFLLEEHDLVNKQRVRIPRLFNPKILFLERGKGE